jgi:hypothetical protein
MKQLFSILFLLFALSAVTGAQQPGVGYAHSSVKIYNSSSQKIKILIGEYSAKMDTQLLNKNSTWFSPQYKSNPIVKIQTQEMVITYKLELGSSYMIYWNDQKKCWDLKRLIQ